MENQALSSSSSSTPKPEKLKSLIVAIEESKEKATRNNNLKLGSPQDVTSERRVEIPSFGSGYIRNGSEIMKFYPPQSNKIYTCHFCQKWFTDSHAFGGHQNAHKQVREWEKKRKEMEADFPELGFLNSYLDKPHILLGGYSQDACFGSGPVRRGSENMKFYPPQSNKIYTCHFCQKWFTDSQAFGDHQNVHKQERQWEKKGKEMEADFPGLAFLNRYLDKPHILLGGYSQVVLREENLISKIGMNKDVEIDDDDDDDDDDEDQPEEGKYKSWGMDLSLSL